MSERRITSPLDIAAYAIGIAMFVGILYAATRQWNDSEPGPADPSADELYDAHLKAASLAHASGDLETAITEFTEAITANPGGFEAHISRGVAFQQLGDWQAAMSDYQRAMQLNADEFGPWNNLAMLYACCPDDAIRDGESAVKFAREACRISGWKHAAAMNTLACAYAESGDWRSAVAFQQDAIELLGDEHPKLQEYQLLLQQFENESPYRLPSGNAK